MGKLIFKVGNIVDDELLKGKDLIINPTNPKMVAGAGVSGEIFKKADVDKLERYTQARFKTDMVVGEIRITNGFNLGMDILFVQGPNAYDNDNNISILLDTYKNMLSVIKKEKYKNIIMPSLGTGTYGYNHYEVAQEVVKLLKHFTSINKVDITYVLYDEVTKLIYEQYK